MDSWTVSENRFRSWDGTELFYRAWEPKKASRKALIIVHRGHEHSGRVGPLVEDLGLTDCWAFCWDFRGHGQSPGERGHAGSFYHHVKDLDAFVKHVAARHGLAVEDMAVVASSVGSVVATAWVHDFAPRIRGMVLAAPAFRIKLYVPLAIPSLRLMMKAKPKAQISSYVKSKMLTHDPAEARKYDEDKLITREIAVNVLLGLHDTSTRIVQDAGAIHAPVLMFIAGSDYVVKEAPQRRFFEGLSSMLKEMEVYPGFYHSIFYEKERAKPISRTREFLARVFEREPSYAHLTGADREGYTKKEYDYLTSPPPALKGLCFGFQRAAMRTLGRLSTGVRLGLETGFDSGKTLDYVYENKPDGITPLGRLMDRNYLESVGWRGIRERGENLKAALRETIQRVDASGRDVRILDVAAGLGRYVMDVLAEKPDRRATALLRDFTPANVEAGIRAAAARNLGNVTFVQGDAFNEQSIRDLTPKPTIAIVSGLYELFPENAQVIASLRGIAAALEPDGFLIYTGQPWHPQVEMIARTLTNRDGKPWIMRRRTQAEMDELVRSVGLSKIDESVDSYGIFTVSTAQKRTLS